METEWLQGKGLVPGRVASAERVGSIAMSPEVEGFTIVRVEFVVWTAGPIALRVGLVVV